MFVFFPFSPPLNIHLIPPYHPPEGEGEKERKMRGEKNKKNLN